MTDRRPIEFLRAWNVYRKGQVDKVPAHIADALCGPALDGQPFARPALEIERGKSLTVGQVEACESYRQLQEWAKAVGIQANLPADEIWSALLEELRSL